MYDARLGNVFQALKRRIFEGLFDGKLYVSSISSGRLFSKVFKASKLIEESTGERQISDSNGSVSVHYMA